MVLTFIFPSTSCIELEVKGKHAWQRLTELKALGRRNLYGYYFKKFFISFCILATDVSS